MEKKRYMTPVAMIVEVDEVEMLCTSGTISGNLDNEGEDGMDEDASPASLFEDTWK